MLLWSALSQTESDICGGLDKTKTAEAQSETQCISV